MRALKAPDGRVLIFTGGYKTVPYRHHWIKPDGTHDRPATFKEWTWAKNNLGPEIQVECEIPQLTSVDRLQIPTTWAIAPKQKPKKKHRKAIFLLFSQNGVERKFMCYQTVAGNPAFARISDAQYRTIRKVAMGQSGYSARREYGYVMLVAPTDATAPLFGIHDFGAVAEKEQTV